MSLSLNVNIQFTHANIRWISSLWGCKYIENFRNQLLALWMKWVSQYNGFLVGIHLIQKSLGFLQFGELMSEMVFLSLQIYLTFFFSFFPPQKLLLFTLFPRVHFLFLLFFFPLFCWLTLGLDVYNI